MPYHLEKGPIFAAFEALYNDQTRLSNFLRDLWSGGADSLGLHGVLSSPLAHDPSSGLTPAQTGTIRKTSMRNDWFGERSSSGAGQPGFGTVDSDGELILTTGYWALYYGQVRTIVFETLTRAAEVALGVQRPDPVPATAPPPNRNWKVEFFWKCGQPRFEGWVTWRDHQDGANGGQVTVVFATPATPDHVLRAPGGGAAEIMTAPSQWPWQGMWVCTHENHKQYVVISSLPTPKEAWLVPTSAVLFTRGVGDVKTWAPFFGEGGASDQPSPVAFQSGT
jgi:hypothetical protein